MWQCHTHRPGLSKVTLIRVTCSFVSVGRPYRPEQEAFVTAFEEYLLGLVQIDLDNLGEDQTPRLITTGVDPSTVVFA